MNRRLLFVLLLLIGLLISGCNSSNSDTDKIVLNSVKFPSTPEQVIKECNDDLAKADESIRQIIDKKEKTFKNTIAAFDTVIYEVEKNICLQDIMLSVSPDRSIRDASKEALLKSTAWTDRVSYNKQLYLALEQYAATNPGLVGEDLRLIEKIRRRFTRNGIRLPQQERSELEETRTRISTLSAQFQSNIHNYDQKSFFTPEDLQGLPESSLNLLGLNDDGNYQMDPRLVNQLTAILTWATREETRLRAYKAYHSVAINENAPIMAEIIQLRAKVARLLGYETYADYVIEARMAKTADNAITLQEDLSNGLEEKFRNEQQALLKLKIRESGKPDAVLNAWDLEFYQRIFLSEQFDLDMESAKQYFSMENCLQGLFTVCERSFGVEIFLQETPGGTIWDKDVRLYQVNDTATGQPLGTFYLDLYPRDGKYSYYAAFLGAGSKTLADGTRERPVSAIIANFPRPTDETPSLLSFYEVSTLFHEMGHVMHTLLSKNRYAMTHGFNVAWDFVEVPSQLLEQWLTDPAVLDLFAANYQDPDDKLSAAFQEKMAAANKAFMATEKKIILGKAMTDLILHTRFSENDEIDVVKVGNDTLEKYYLPCVPGTAQITRFIHLTSGYAAGYYGYQWADTIVYDLASEFRQSDQGFLDWKLGMKLRKEIYEPGASRNENDSVKAFLGREWTTGAYLNHLGIE